MKSASDGEARTRRLRRWRRCGAKRKCGDAIAVRVMAMQLRAASGPRATVMSPKTVSGCRLRHAALKTVPAVIERMAPDVERDRDAVMAPGEEMAPGAATDLP